eukprot:COSAG06_NODE_2825_length_6217_cov_39.483164_2_plen_57_part_00
MNSQTRCETECDDVTPAYCLQLDIHPPLLLPSVAPAERNGSFKHRADFIFIKTTHF